jgi:hypothetical protein
MTQTIDEKRYFEKSKALFQAEFDSPSNEQVPLRKELVRSILSE